MKLLQVLAILAISSSVALADAPKLVGAARQQTLGRATYDGTYVRIPYPMGDVPADRGVCTDVVIRAYRAIGIDLQALVHEDMRGNFSLYPQQWGMSRPDSMRWRYHCRHQPDGGD